MLVGYLGAVAVGVGLWLLVAGFARRASPALRVLADAPVTPRLDTPLRVRLAAPLLARLERLGRRITPAGQVAALRARLDAAGLAVPVQTLLAARAITVGLGLLLGLATMVAGAPALLAVPGGVAVGWVLPGALVSSRARARQGAIDSALPEALDLLALIVQAGLGLEQALDEVADEVDGPLGEELERLLREQQLGRSRQEALEAMCARNSSDDLRSLLVALLQADRLGTPIADTLRVQARELRRRRRGVARERAGKAPVKLLFPLILGVFPAMFVVVVGPGILSIADALFR